MKKLFIFLALVGALLRGQVQGQANYTLFFDGQNDYVDLGDTVGDSIRTIEMWFKLEGRIDPTLDTTQTLIMRSNSGPNTAEFGLCFPQHNWAKAGHLRFHYTDNVNAFWAAYSDTNVWQGGVWHHVAGVLHPQKGMLLFIDGKLQSQQDTLKKATDPSTDWLGVGVWGNLGKRWFLGQIEDLRLSAVAEYSMDFSPPCQHLAIGTGKAVYNFNEGPGSTVALDGSGNGYTGIIYGAGYVQDSSCKNPVANDQLLSREEVKAYPNPFSDEAVISIPRDGGAYDFNLINTLGMSVREINGVREEEVRISGSGLDPGIYYLRYSSDTGNVGTRRMVVY